MSYQGEQKEGASIASILTESDLTYLADEEINCISERTQRRTPAQTASYSQGETVVFNLNTVEVF